MKKVMVFVGKNAPSSLPLLESNGTILANYGESVLVQTDDSGIQAFQSNGLKYREIPDQPLVKLGAYVVDTQDTAAHSTVASASAMTRALTGPPATQTYHILHLAGPMHPDWKSSLEQRGVAFQRNIDDDFYLVEIANDKIDDVRALPFVESVTNYEPELKINPALFTNNLIAELPTRSGLKLLDIDAAPTAPSQPNPDLIDLSRKRVVYNPETDGNVEILADRIAGNPAFLTAVQNAGARIINVNEDRVIAFAPPEAIPAIAQIAEVKEINPFQPFKLHNNVATGIIHADVLLNGQGLSGDGQIVAIADTGLDTGVNNATLSDDFEGRVIQIVALGRPGDASDTHGHGTHVAGSVMGNGANSNGNVRGIAPQSQVFFQSVMDSTGNLGGLPSNLVDLFQPAFDNGARIHTNSWGSIVGNSAYNSNSQNADQFTFNHRDFLVLFAAGNEGDTPAPNNRITPPGTAKNVLTIGASESIRPLPPSVSFPPSPKYPGGPSIPTLGTQADNQNQVANFSSIGPAANNRRKPDIVAPGSWILSVRSSVAVADTGPDGIADTGDEDGVTTHAESVGYGLPGGPVLGGGNQNTPAMPAGSGAGAEQLYMYDSGTSMATPITAGACALLRQHLIEQRGHTPSAALIKAIAINGAVDMGFGVPNISQGWGRLDLTNALFPPTTNRVQFDDTLANAVGTGDIRSYDVFVSSATNPLMVTLVWRDAPGATIQNRLHLRVTHVATSTTQTSDLITDIRNNVQKVIFNAPTTGTYHIEVEGVNVTTGIPEFPAAIRQDFALVVSNATGFSCNPSDIVQVIDRSGSMGFSGYMEPAKERAKQLIDILQINDEAGVVSFNSTATADLGLTPINDQGDKNDARTAINLLTSIGTTDLRAGLEQGRTTLGPNTGRPQAIVFLSDGFHTTTTPAIDNTFLDTFAAANIKVYTVALGPDSDLSVLNTIAVRTGTGAVNVVESAADLHKLNEIYYDILGNMGCNTVVHLNSAVISRLNNQPVLIDKSVKEALFAISSNAQAKIDFRLQDPAGNVIAPGTSGAFYLAGSTHQYYRILSPKPGAWKLLVRSETSGLTATTAVMADSEFKFRCRVDPDFLFRGKLLLHLEAFYRDKPLKGAKVTATATFATLATDELIKRHRTDLDRIKIPKDLLKGDQKADPDKLRLDQLAVQMRKEGKDLFARKTTRIQLTDDGKDKDPRADDGIYTAFMDVKQRKIRGNMLLKLTIEGENTALGKYSRTKLVPVFVPTL